MEITDDDRQRFYELYNEENLDWNTFWEQWSDDEVRYMISVGG